MNFEQPIRQNFDAVIQSADKNEKTITCIIVSNQTNRGKRKVDVKGCQYDDYLKSPVVLAFHDDERVIGRCQWLKFTEEGIIAKFEFRDSELANDIYDLYKGGFLTSWSIGFLPVTWNYEEEEGQEIIHITKWILLEVSAVSIPMDANAITLALDQGLIHDEYLIQSVNNAKNQHMNEEILNNSLTILSDLSSMHGDIISSCKLWQSSIDEIRLSFDSLKTRFMQIETMLSELQPQAVNQADSINIIDFSNFSKEINDSVKQHINALKGKV